MVKARVGILLFNEVEVLDFAGPHEVFSRARLIPGVESRRSDDSARFEVFTVAATIAPIAATGGLRVVPDFDFGSAPPIDLLVAPGGFGTRALLRDEATLAWIRQAAAAARRVTSVCTGALLLARVGLLAGGRATTHRGALALLAEVDPTIRVEPEARVVEDGIITSAGVSAGIDMALAMVEILCGRAVADETAHYMDYPRAVRAGSLSRTAPSPLRSDPGR